MSQGVLQHVMLSDNTFNNTHSATKGKETEKKMKNDIWFLHCMQESCHLEHNHMEVKGRVLHVQLQVQQASLLKI